ncbi:hypothetical protein PSTT_06697 [Puccinia striiformis]|nr:hypothetical protein PSTT_06697 [Puccinia striiformis]
MLVAYLLLHLALLASSSNILALTKLLGLLIIAPLDLLISSLPKAQSLKCCQQLGCLMF